MVRSKQKLLMKVCKCLLLADFNYLDVYVVVFVAVLMHVGAIDLVAELLHLALGQPHAKGHNDPNISG